MNKKVLITGGNGGIAIAIKEELELEGYEVYAPGRQELDVTNIISIEKAVSEFVPDILVNAGHIYMLIKVNEGCIFSCIKYL